MLVYSESTDNKNRRSLADFGCSKESIQHDYSESKKIGSGCYTLAEIPADLVGEEYIFNVGDTKMYGGYHNVPLQQGTTYKIYVAVKVALPVSCYFEQEFCVEN